MFTRRGPRAPALQAVQAAIVAAAMRGVYSVGQRWTKWSEEWYWKRLVDKKKMFVSIYEDEPRSQRPLISKRSRNLSQTPREQCELEGHVREGLERPGPGQVRNLLGLGCGGDHFTMPIRLFAHNTLAAVAAPRSCTARAFKCAANL